MSDEYDDRRGRPRPDPDVRSDEEAQDHVAHLLRDAGAAEPMPADVAARLDAVLGDLVRAASGTGPSPDPSTSAVPDPPDPAPGPRPAADPSRLDPAGRPDELAARRRRRRWPQLLVAAAAVSVLGLGAGTLLGSMGGGGTDSAAESAAGVAAEDSGAAGGDNAAQEDAASGLRQPAPAGEPEKPEELGDDRATTEDADAQALATVGLPRLRTDSLAVDVQRAVDLSRPARTDADLGRLCVQPEVDEDDAWLPVRLDGSPAVLVLRAPVEGRRTAEVFTCDEGDTPAASARIDAR